MIKALEDLIDEIDAMTLEEFMKKYEHHLNTDEPYKEIIEPKAYFSKDKHDTGVEFCTESKYEKHVGTLEWSAYSYYIDDVGTGGLTQEETKQLFKAMFQYYDAQDGDKFWED